MDITRQYIKQWMQESSKKKFEENNFKYAYTTRDLGDDSIGWVVADSPEELQEEWENNYEDTYGSFNPKKILVMKPATSVDNAMILILEPNGGNDIIYPTIKDAVAYTLKEFKAHMEDEDIANLKSLLSITDIKELKDKLSEVFFDYQDLGYFDGAYEYVSGPMPSSDGFKPGKVVGSTNFEPQKKSRDYNYYLNRIKKGAELEKVPEKFRTAELCKIAVENYGGNLKYVPDKLKTPELCKIVVEDHGAALEYVPDKLKTPELCKIAVEHYYGAALPYVPADIRKQLGDS